jgi:polyphosphate glucokinase
MESVTSSPGMDSSVLPVEPVVASSRSFGVKLSGANIAASSCVRKALCSMPNEDRRIAWKSVARTAPPECPIGMFSAGQRAPGGPNDPDKPIRNGAGQGTRAWCSLDSARIVRCAAREHGRNIPSADECLSFWPRGRLSSSAPSATLSGASHGPWQQRVRILVVDIGGSHVKVARSWRRTPFKIDSGPTMTAAQMVKRVQALARDWAFDVVSIGYPGPVRAGRPLREPHNLGGGWRRMNFERAFGKPVRLVNDAAMQALGSYAGGRMLFLGLGTGLGSAIVDDGRLEPLELAHLPYRKGQSFEDYVGTRGLEKLGLRKWSEHVSEVCELLRNALVCDYVVLGGGNVNKLARLPRHARRGSNLNAIEGGIRIWAADATPLARRRVQRKAGARAGD